MVAREDDFLVERQIAAHDVDGESYLYVPGQLLVSTADVEKVRGSLTRRGMLRDEDGDDAGGTRRTGLDPTWARRLGRVLDRDSLSKVLRSLKDLPPVREGDLPPPGQDPTADGALAELGLERVHVRQDADLPSLVAGYREEGFAVSPNHVVHWEPIWKGSPGDLPEPADRLEPPADGKGGPRVAILDTGIQPGWDADPWFAHRVDSAGAIDVEVLDVDRDGMLDAQAGHGTFIASLVAAGCPSATIIPRRVLNSYGLTSDADLARAILAIARLEPDVLVLSLGCYAADDRPPPAIEAALAHLPATCAVVAAAGNAGQSRVFWPAALKTVVAVGAHDGDAPSRAHFSNFGWWVDACAAGVRVHAKFVEFDGGVQGVMEPGDFEGWAVWSGTSFAAPIVAGRLARHMVDRGCDAPTAVRDLVRAPGLTTLTDLGVVVA